MCRGRVHKGEQTLTHLLQMTIDKNFNLVLYLLQGKSVVMDTSCRVMKVHIIICVCHIVVLCMTVASVSAALCNNYAHYN